MAAEIVSPIVITIQQLPAQWLVLPAGISLEAWQLRRINPSPRAPPPQITPHVFWLKDCAAPRQQNWNTHVINLLSLKSCKTIVILKIQNWNGLNKKPRRNCRATAEIPGQWRPGISGLGTRTPSNYHHNLTSESVTMVWPYFWK